MWHVRDFLGDRQLVRKIVPRLSARVQCRVCDLGECRAGPPCAAARRAGRRRLQRRRPRSVSSPTHEASVLDSLAGLPPAAEGTVRIGLVATYARWKGHRLFLEAAAHASTRSSVPLRFYVVGGPIYLGAESQITEHDLRTWINLFGLTTLVGSSHSFRILNLRLMRSTLPSMQTPPPSPLDAR